MALWMACEQGKKRNKFRVQVASADIRVAPNAMRNAEKVSLWGDGITTESLAGMSFSPNLSTLMVRDTNVKEWPSEIFQDSLKVLDLMGSKGSRQLPVENGCLKNLEYFNTAYTSIRLPTCVSEWKKLRFLIVDEATIVPGGVISSLFSLQMFEQQYIFGGCDYISSRESMERGMLHELEGLKYMMDIRLVLFSATGIEMLLDSPKLQMCTTTLAVKNLKASMLEFGTETSTSHLERLQLEYCHISDIKLGPSLVKVSILVCNEVLNLNSLIYVPNLCVLEVFNCLSMSELIGEETRSSDVIGTSLFSSLTSLTLKHSKKLRSICPQSALPFPSLKLMNVQACPSLRKLPFDSNTVSTIPPDFIIEGDREWWDGLEWDTQATKDAFTPKLIELY